MARFNKAKKVLLDSHAGVQFDFADGRSITVKVTDLNDDIRAQAMVHGISQKVGDSYASAEDVEEAYDAATATVTSLLDGKWTTRTPGEGAGVTMVTEALFRVTSPEGHTMEQCAQIIENMDDDQIEGLKKLPPVKAALDAIRAERAVERAKKSSAEAASKPIDLSAIMGK